MHYKNAFWKKPYEWCKKLQLCMDLLYLSGRMEHFDLGRIWFLDVTFIITTILSYYWPMLRTTCVYSFLKSRRRSKITTLIDYLFVYFFLKKIPKSFFMHLPLCRNYENRQKKEACKNIFDFHAYFCYY